MLFWPSHCCTTIQSVSVPYLSSRMNGYGAGIIHSAGRLCMEWLLRARAVFNWLSNSWLAANGGRSELLEQPAVSLTVNLTIAPEASWLMTMQYCWASATLKHHIKRFHSLQLHSAGAQPKYMQAIASLSCASFFMSAIQCDCPR